MNLYLFSSSSLYLVSAQSTHRSKCLSELTHEFFSPSSRCKSSSCIGCEAADSWSTCLVLDYQTEKGRGGSAQETAHHHPHLFALAPEYHSCPLLERIVELCLGTNNLLTSVTIQDREREIIGR